MKLYLIRHGESVHNATRTHQSGLPPLSTNGDSQAMFVAKRFRTIPIDVIFSSDYVRARQTAEKIADEIHKDIIYTSLLREVKRPTEIEGKHIYDPSVLEIKQKIQDNWHKKGWHYTDEENFTDLKKRSIEFIKMVERRQESSIAAVSHGLFIRMIVCQMFLGELLTHRIFYHFMKSFRTSNTGITLCENTESRWKIASWNDYAHLGEV